LQWLLLLLSIKADHPVLLTPRDRGVLLEFVSASQAAENELDEAHDEETIAETLRRYRAQREPAFEHVASEAAGSGSSNPPSP
jgi:hypothetical protein